MFKIVQMMRFTPGLNRSEAYERWFGPHAALGRQVPGVRRYVQNAASAALHLVGIDPDRPTTFDGYSCVWFDGRAGFEAATRSAEWAAVVADGGTLFDATFEGAALTAVEEAAHRRRAGRADQDRLVLSLPGRGQERSGAHTGVQQLLDRDPRSGLRGPGAWYRPLPAEPRHRARACSTPAVRRLLRMLVRRPRHVRGDERHARVARDERGRRDALRPRT